MKELAVLYSGGSDSTCAAALMAERYDRIHLVTFRRFGVFCTENAKKNAEKLKQKFGEDKFVHRFYCFDRLFKEVSYARYHYFLAKFGFLNLTTCGLCKLAMHVRMLVYCRENRIEHVCDGANKGSWHFPDQMKEVVEEFRKMYGQFGINYFTPVFELDQQDNITWFDKLGIDQGKKRGEEQTTGSILNKMDIFPTDRPKGTELDRKMQARCFQLILFNVFAHWYYIPLRGFEAYKRECVRYYQDKIAHLIPSIRGYLENRETSRLKGLVE